MKKKKIILPRLRYENAPEVDSQISIGFESDKTLLRGDDRDIVLNLSEQFAEERANCRRYKLYGKMKMIFRNLYAGATSYDYLRERLALISDGSDNNFCGYLPYNEFAFLRDDIHYETSETTSVTTLSGFTGFTFVTSGSTEHQDITAITAPYHNWNLYLSYVSGQVNDFPMKYTLSGRTKTEGDNLITFISGDGIPFRVEETATNYILTSPVQHGINQGEYIVINGRYYYVNSVGDAVYNSELYVINILKSQLSGVTFNPLVIGKRCIDIRDPENATSRYYVHKHTILTSLGDCIIDKVGFESPIWEDEKKLLYENSVGTNDVLVVRNRMEAVLFDSMEPFTLTGITNNLGYTPLDLYSTIIFRNGNGFFDYPPKVGYSFHMHDSWMDDHFDGSTAIETGLTSTSFTREGFAYPFYSGNSLSEGSELYGAFVEYNPKELKERIISESFHKIVSNKNVFNHGQDLDEVYSGATETNPIGLLYQPHYRFKLKELSPYIETSDDTTPVYNLPENAVYFPNERIWRWRDIYEDGYIDPDGYGTDYPYLNDIHFVHKDINFYLRNEKIYKNKKNGIIDFHRRRNTEDCVDNAAVILRGAVVIPTPSITPSISLSITPSISLSATPSISLSVTPSVTSSISLSVTPSITPSVSLSATPSKTPSISLSISISKTPSTIPSNTPSETPSVSLSVLPSMSLTTAPTNTPSTTVTPSISISSTPSASQSITPTTTPSISLSVTSNLPTPSISPSVSYSTTQTPSITTSMSFSLSPSITPSISFTRTPSITPSISFSRTPSISFSRTPSNTPSISFSRTPSITPSISFSKTPSVTLTRSLASPSITPSMSFSRTPSVSYVPLLSAYFVSPTGSDTTGDGSISSPYFTLEKAWDYVSPGDTIYMRGGTYEYLKTQTLDSLSGSSGNPIKILNYPNEHPIIQPHATWVHEGWYYGVFLQSCNYIEIKGIELTEFKYQQTSPCRALMAQHVNNCVFENLSCHDNELGMMLAGNSGNNLILNSDFYNNYDPYSPIPYGNSDGLDVSSIPSSYNNIVRGCRSWNNGDDGFDFWASEGIVTVENCWAWSNGYREDGVTTGGDGNGFKLGQVSGTTSTTRRYIYSSIGALNRVSNFSHNVVDPQVLTCELYNCLSYSAITYAGYQFNWGAQAAQNSILRNNISYGDFAPAYLDSWITNDHNSWNSGYTVNSDDFISLSPSALGAPRQSDGSLPIINFGHLSSTSDLVGTGVAISGLVNDCEGKPYSSPPSLGPFEFSEVSYYLSSTGSDDNDGSLSTPWASIDKINESFTGLTPGDSILFSADESFYGTLNINKSGTSGVDSPFVIGSYGTGSDPIIHGFTTITSGWTNEGGNIYSYVINSDEKTNMVLVDGVQVAMGRWPNGDTYRTFESHSSYSAITDTTLSEETPYDWTGAQVVIRMTYWLLGRFRITNHSGDIITYSGNSVSYLYDGFGYFIQDDLRTLDVENEWYHDTATGKFYIYGDPTGKTIKVATKSNIIRNHGGYDYITIENLALQGSTDDIISFNNGSYANASNAIIQNCDLKYSGSRGIDIVGNNCNIINNVIDQCNDNSVYIASGNNTIVTGNTITNIGMLLGQSKYLSANGIYNGGTGSIIQHNTMDYIGLNGITAGSATSGDLQYNFINHYCMTLNDGGGIYHGPSNTAYNSDYIMNHNICLNGYGNYNGTTSSEPFLAEGIYLDSYCTGHTVQYNICAHNAGTGIKLSSSHDNILENNLCFDNKESQLFSYGAWAGYATLYNNIIRYNQFIGKETTHLTIKTYLSASDNIANYGTSNFNYYARPINQGSNDNTFLTNGTSRTLSGWRAYSSQDADSNTSLGGSVSSLDDIHFIYNETDENKYYELSTSMKDVTNTTYSGVITLSPWTGLVLLGTGSVTLTSPPSVSASITPSVTPSISFSRTPSVSFSRTPSVSFSRTPSVSFSRTPSVSFSRTPSITPTVTSGLTYLTYSGQTYNFTETGTSYGVSVPRTSPIIFSFIDNSVTAVNTVGYLIEAGTEISGTYDNNLDGELICGNKFTWNGDFGGLLTAMTITHGLFTGHMKDVDICHNYLWRVPMGIIRKSGNNESNTTGGVYYNILRTFNVGGVVKGMSNVVWYNNTFYQDRDNYDYQPPTGGTWRGAIDIYANTDSSIVVEPYSLARGTKIKNNIFYSVYKTYAINVMDTDSLTGFECDYNIYWVEEGDHTPIFNHGGTQYTWAQWTGAGYDTHSVVMNPNFNNTTDLVPGSKSIIQIGTDLGTYFNTGLSTTATWSVGVPPVKQVQSGIWQVGARIFAP